MVKASLRYGQAGLSQNKVKERSRQGQGKIKATSRQGQRKVKARPKPGQGEEEVKTGIR